MDPRTQTFGFLADIHRYVAASDLVLTKPGALSTYEALACGTPVLLLGIRGLMPQESANEFRTSEIVDLKSMPLEFPLSARPGPCLAFAAIRE